MMILARFSKVFHSKVFDVILRFPTLLDRAKIMFSTVFGGFASYPKIAIVILRFNALRFDENSATRVIYSHIKASTVLGFIRFTIFSYFHDSTESSILD